MYHLRRNKSELIVLTGAIYAFVAYLTAFTLEILFLIDLTRRSSEILANFGLTSGSSTSTSTTSTTILSSDESTLDDGADLATHTTPFDRLNFESIQAHTTVACLTISILYFVVFITSLILIVALILRSTFMLLVWMCAMTTLYLPEFGLVSYVALYNWGLDTRNGQTELAFYLLRAALNLVFIYRAHRLYKHWHYEKNFFRLKSGSYSSAAHFGAPHTPAYDSPYFITGDSLSTTINPIFSSATSSSSTLNLNRYDFVRDQFNQQQQHTQASGQQRPGYESTGGAAGTSRTTSPTTNNTSLYGTSDNTDASGPIGSQLARHQRHDKARDGRLPTERVMYEFGSTHHLTRAQAHLNPSSGKQQFYLGANDLQAPGGGKQRQTRLHPQQQHMQGHHQTSLLSINDDFAEYELDLDYRTLGRSTMGKQNHRLDRSPVSPNRFSHQPHQMGALNANSTGQRFQPHLDDQRPSRLQANRTGSMSRSHDDLAYSTHSLDRRSSRDFTLGEQVVLRPLGHQPFEYLHRPGSTANLNNYH